jgi:hypothetical protein
MKRLTDPSFRYVRAVDTDIRKTFARIKREQQKNKEEAVAKVRIFPKAKP